MKVTIKTIEDVRKLLLSGKTPIQVSLIHWKENRELMRENNFQIVNHLNNVCALCFIYDGNCKNCPLTLAGERCECGASLWRKINKCFTNINAKNRLQFSVVADTNNLANKTEIYEIKNKISSYTNSLIDVLEKLRLKEIVEKNKGRIRVLMDKKTGKEWVDLYNVLYIADSKGNKIWDVKDINR